MRCKICGFNKRGEEHTLGYQHLNLVRKPGIRNGILRLEKRVEKRPKPLEIENDKP